jgi:hypothetical protein
LVGNVSIYPASLPHGAVKALGQMWLIANVATHPEYRGRGIARRLMEASIESIRMRSRSKPAVAVLQVEENNTAARRLYESLGFSTERIWNHWRRSSMARVPQLPADPNIHITHRRRSEWQAEYALAERVRPQSMGGVGWLRPTFSGLFRQTLRGRINNLLNLRSMEHLVIRSPDQNDVRAALWIENGLAASSIQLTLMTDPDYMGLYDSALISYAVRRFGLRSPLSIEHPSDEQVTSALLARYHFNIQRAFVNMRWEEKAH